MLALREIGRRGWETTYASFIRPENRQSYLNVEFWSEERLQQVIFESDAINLVAEVDDRACGFITCEPLPDGRYEVTRLYVDPDTRSRGIGAELVQQVITRAREKGVREVVVNAFADNHAGRRFYERQGFEFLKETSGPVGDQILEDVWYVMPLADNS